MRTSHPTRREFLRDASALLGAAALTGAVPSAKRTNMPNKPLGVALVGLGGYATGQLAPSLEQTTECRLSGIVTGTPSKAATWKAKYDLPDTNVYDYGSFDRIADNPDIDVVYVVLPNSMHAEYAIRAARAGKHVISEKPMATSVRDCERMIEACEKAGVQLSVGYRLHFDPFHREMMRLGQEQVYGPVSVVEGSFSFTYRDTKAWRFNKQMAGGGALLDVGIYAINAARYVTGEEPVALQARAYNTRPDVFTDIEQTVTWQMEFPSGAVSIHSSSYSGYVNRLYFMAPEGWAEIDPSYHYDVREGRTSDGPMEFPFVKQQAVQMDDFATCIRQNRKSSVSGEEGLKDMKVIEAIYRSAERGGERVTV